MSTAAPVALHDGDLSALYRVADAASGHGQRRTKLLVRGELLSLVVASAAGVTTWRVGGGRHDVLAVLSAVAFLLALGCTAVRAGTRPEERWYVGRAAAESARTLGWRYAVGGAPFALDEPPAAVHDRFLRRLAAVVEQLDDRDLGVPGSGAREITPAMRQLRAQDAATRRAVYRRDRVTDQLGWYTRRARTHSRAARTWTGLGAALSALGVLGALAEVFGADVDLVGVLAAAASSAVAWNQLNQHRTLASAYAVTARELRIVRDRVDEVPDADWATFVSDAEDAISREHTLWLARHGHLPGATRE